MKPLSEWPLDGLIIFVAIILSLLTLLGSSFVREKDRNTLLNGKYQLLSLMIHKIWWGLSVIMAVIVTYGVSQAGHCPTMTDVENTQNEQIGIVLAMAFWAMVAIFYHQAFLLKKEFDFTTYDISSPFFHKKYFWKNFKGLQFSKFGQFLLFEESEKIKKVFIPWKRLGFLGLSAYINSRLMNITNPVDPTFDEKFIEPINNKRVYVVFFELDEDLADKKQSGFFGKIISISAESILIQKDDGDIFQAPPNLRGFIPMEEHQEPDDCPWDIGLEKDAAVDWIAIYYVTKGKEHVH
jgi:hypothetical protein